MTTLEENSWVWIHDEVRTPPNPHFLSCIPPRTTLTALDLQEERYLPAQVLKPFRKGEVATVRTEDGEVISFNFIYKD
jgi:hypothetical protein